MSAMTIINSVHDVNLPSHQGPRYHIPIRRVVSPYFPDSLRLFQVPRAPKHTRGSPDPKPPNRKTSNLEIAALLQAGSQRHTSALLVQINRLPSDFGFTFASSNHAWIVFTTIRPQHDSPRPLSKAQILLVHGPHTRGAYSYLS